MMHLFLNTAISLCLALQQTGEVQPRVAIDAGPAVAPTFDPIAGRNPAQSLRLTMKLVDSVRGRAVNSNLISQVGADLTPLHELAAAEGLTFQPLIKLSEAKVNTLLARAEARSGLAQPDLLAMFSVTVPGNETAELERIGEALRAFPLVEYVHIQLLGCLPPVDIPPTTADHTSSQTYLGADPGVNAEGAWSQGVFGAGVRFSDCEYGWGYAHEEYNSLNLNPEPNQTIHPDVYTYGWDDHGTAALGEIVATDNGYGVTGTSPGVETYTYPEWTVEDGYRRVDAIASAIADSSPGDVVLLEMQTLLSGASGYGPAELDPNVFIVVQAGSASGVVVVGAAGNGNQDLDSSLYDNYRNMGDSGAILVGAGSSDINHNKSSFSTYGSRVDVQGWGGSVFSSGYGDFILYGGDDNQSYTSTFSGTSSASAMVAGVVALVQARSVVLNGIGLPPSTVRQLLKDTGIPQGSGGHIGPLPDAGAAVANVGLFNPYPWVDLGLGLAGVNGLPVLAPTGYLAAGSDYNIQLGNAESWTSCWLVVGFTNISVPFKGGTLVPAADLVFGPYLSTINGDVSFTGVFPPGVPADSPLYFQWWIADSAGPVGFSASNAAVGTTQ